MPEPGSREYPSTLVQLPRASEGLSQNYDVSCYTLSSIPFTYTHPKVFNELERRRHPIHPGLKPDTHAFFLHQICGKSSDRASSADTGDMNIYTVPDLFGNSSSPSHTLNDHHFDLLQAYEPEPKANEGNCFSSSGNFSSPRPHQSDPLDPDKYTLDASLIEANNNAYYFNSINMMPAAEMTPRPGIDGIVQPQPHSGAVPAFLAHDIREVNSDDSPDSSGGADEQAMQLARFGAPDYARLFHRVQEPTSYVRNHVHASASANAPLRRHKRHRADPSSSMFVSEHDDDGQDQDQDRDQDVAEAERSDDAKRYGLGQPQRKRRLPSPPSYTSHRRDDRRARPGDKHTSRLHPYSHAREQRSRATASTSAGVHKRRSSTSTSTEARPSHSRRNSNTRAPVTTRGVFPTRPQAQPTTTITTSPTNALKIDPFPCGALPSPRTTPLTDPINLFILSLRRDHLRQWSEIASELNARKDALGLEMKDFTDAAVYGRFTRNASRIAVSLGQPGFDVKDYMHLRGGDGGGVRAGRVGVAGGAVGGAGGGGGGMARVGAPERHAGSAREPINVDGDGDDTQSASMYSTLSQTSSVNSIESGLLQAGVERASSSEIFWNAVARSMSDMDESGRVYDARELWRRCRVGALGVVAERH